MQEITPNSRLASYLHAGIDSAMQGGACKRCDFCCLSISFLPAAVPSAFPPAGELVSRRLGALNAFFPSPDEAKLTELSFEACCTDATVAIFHGSLIQSNSINK
jgi:hypothetical protein